MLNCSRININMSYFILTFYMNLDQLSDKIRFWSFESYFNFLRLLWIKLKVHRVYLHIWGLIVVFKFDISSKSSLIFKLHIFFFLSIYGNESKVDKGFELYVRSWSKGMKVKLVRLFLFVKLDIYVVMEVSQGISFEADIKFYCQTCG